MITITSHNQLYPGMTEEDKSCFFSFLGLSSSCTRTFSEQSFSKTQDHTMQIKKDFPNTKSKAKINQSIFEMNFHSYGGKKTNCQQSKQNKTCA